MANPSGFTLGHAAYRLDQGFWPFILRQVTGDAGLQHASDVDPVVVRAQHQDTHPRLRCCQLARHLDAGQVRHFYV